MQCQIGGTYNLPFQAVFSATAHEYRSFRCYCVLSMNVAQKQWMDQR